MFLDARLPQDIERGASGGPRFKTTVLSLQSGHERRNMDWADTRGLWDVGYGIMPKYQDDPTLADLDLDALYQMFYAAGGRLNTFRFKDWLDFEIGIENGQPLSSPQTIGLGDDVTQNFQAFKRYEITTATGVSFFNRTVTLLVVGTTQVYLDGVLQGSGFTINSLTGLITFTAAPASTGGTGPGGEEVVAIRTEFDNHVRFDTDHFDASLEHFNAGSWPNIPITEVLETPV